jgi:TolA-binding protein
MKYIRAFTYVSLFLVLFGPSLEAQQFSRSRGMLLFNQGKYDEAVQEIKNWIASHPLEEDIARYYLGESYYNMAMQSEQLGQMRRLLRQAGDEFGRVLRFPGTRTRFPKIYYASLLKRGWCFYRRAETGEQPLTLLNLAAKAFEEGQRSAPDSVVMVASFMKAESRFREAQLRKNEVFFSSFSDSKSIRATLSAFEEAENEFSRVWKNQSADPFLRAAAGVRMQDVKVEVALFISSIPDDLFPVTESKYKKGSPRRTALNLLSTAVYADRLNAFPSEYRSRIRPLILYSDGVRYFYRYLLSSDPEDKRKFLDVFYKLPKGLIDDEIAFRKGNADQNTLSLRNNEQFLRLAAQDASSSYYQCLPSDGRGIHEAYFWLGSVQYVLDRPEGIENLTRFIQRYLHNVVDLRRQALLDYARYWRAVLYLQRYRKDPGKLRELRRFLNQFHPKIASLERRRNLLQKLVLLELDEPVQENVLQQGSPNWIQDALDLVQYLLRRAATVVGSDRLHYLTLLERILYYTNFQGGNETLFYQGLEKSLLAEIQGDEDEKRKIFLEAADLMAQVQPPYKDEADYVRARSLFFAERYDEAKKIFVRLINEKKSLRSLFYFAEILRLRGYGEAAKACYEVVKQKTKGSQEGNFWYANADAAIALCENRADGSRELGAVRYRDVVFPDHLLQDPSISYERLADRQFILFQNLQESLDVMRKFGLPPLRMAVSVNAPAISIFAERNFPGLPAPIDEMLKKETSVLEFIVLDAGAYPQGVKIAVNGITLEPVRAGVFRTKPFYVGERVTLSVEGPGSYPFFKEVDVTYPGTQREWIALTPRVRFAEAGISRMDLTLINLLNRVDRNAVLRPDLTAIPEGSDLEKDLKESLSLRDLVFHPGHNLFLVVDAANPKALRLYSASGARFEESPFLQLELDGYDLGRFVSPEGIALDVEGNIYITDFAVHRVVVLDKSGKYLYHFGTAGVNSPENVGKPVRLTFPTRIFVEEDHEGIEVKTNGETTRIFRQSYLLIADRYGIYRCDLRGTYLETVVTAESLGVAPGEIYAFGVRGYGEKAKLWVLVRKTGEFRAFVASKE